MAHLFLRVRLDVGGQLGPGKVELLEQVARTGSIRRAAAAMTMSYRRAWLLLEEMETMFGAPVILRSTGGARGGGATLSPLGERLIRHYRNVEKRAAAATAADLRALGRLAKKTRPA